LARAEVCASCFDPGVFDARGLFFAGLIDTKPVSPAPNAAGTRAGSAAAFRPVARDFPFGGRLGRRPLSSRKIGTCASADAAPAANASAKLTRTSAVENGRGNGGVFRAVFG
jgi:hypothetical protein